MASLPDHLKPVPVGREKLSPEVREAHQRARVLDAAIAVFAEKGYPAATVDDIVAAAKIGVGSFYGHFGGKEECLLEVYDRIEGEARSKTTAAAAGPDWANRICLGLRELLSLIAANPERGKIALVEVQTGGPAAVDRYRQSVDDAAAVLREGRGHLDSKRHLPDSLEHTTVSGIAWLLHRRLTAGETDSLPRLFPELAQLVLEPYLGEEMARETIEKSTLAPSS